MFIKRNHHNLAIHNVRVFYFITLFGTINLLDPVITLFYFHRGLSASDILIILFMYCAATLVSEIPTGAFADRFGPKASFLTGSLISIFSTSLLLVADNLWWFSIQGLLWGLSTSFFSGSDDALIYESLKESGQEKTMSQVMAKISSVMFSVTIFTSLIGAYLVRDLAESQFQFLILIGILFKIIEFLLIFSLINPKSFDQFRDNPYTHVKNGWQIIRRSPDLIKVFLNFTIVLIPSVVIFGKFEQPYVTGAGLPVAWLGVLYASAALLSMLITRHLAWLLLPFKRTTLMQLSGIVTLLAVTLASFLFDSLWIALVLFFVLRMLRSIRQPLYSGIINEHIPSGSRATTLSLLNLVDSAFDLIILGTMSFVATLGLPAIFIGCALIIGVGLLFPVREAKHVQEQEGRHIV